MDIKLLGPELENVQSDARRELSETIERRKIEVEKEVIENLSELASDGKRVLKSQKQTYEMMLQLDSLVKEHEELFLRVNELCSSTGVSLNAIIDRMVEKNREMRVQGSSVGAVEIPEPSDLDKKKHLNDDGQSILTETERTEGLNYSLGQGQDLLASNGTGDLGDEQLGAKIQGFDLDDSYDPNVIKYDWQRDTFSLSRDEIVQDLPVESTAEQTFNVSAMSDAEIEAARENLAATSEYRTVNLNSDAVVNDEVDIPVVPDVPNEVSYLRVKGRRLHRWASPQVKYTSLLRVTAYGEDFSGRSNDYRDISIKIGDLQINYREFSPEEDNVTLDNLDQAIGASKSLDVSEKRRLYRKLNSSAKRIERYARIGRRGR